MWKPAILSLLYAVSCSQAFGGETSRLGVRDYRERVYAAWLGQIIGNIYGLTYEFRFIEEPGPDAFPYGFGDSLDRVRAAKGAFSDDDTDIEYMYLLQMEKHGVEPTYRQLADAWKHHVRDRVWVANRNALTLMHAGYSPPTTGSRHYNPNWFQIDPQLINEIWAVTAPGMVGYASRKSAWAARITNDGFGIEPTVHYAAMYAAAFFEKDIEKLVDIGTAALPEGSRFAGVVEHMKRLHRQYPGDWRAARQVMADTYYGAFDYNRDAWPAVDAILNGAAGILALLYGGGDFQRTLDLACGLGFDADNQAATMSGLLGIVHGLDGIPGELLYPLGEAAWEKPFNDVYRNVSRHDLPDASIRDLAERTAAQGGKVILANGGRIVRENGADYYEINRLAGFSAPFEMVTAPVLLAEAGRPFSFRFYFGDDASRAGYRLTRGTLPPGLGLAGNRIEGIPSQPGQAAFGIEVISGKHATRETFTIRVHGENLAASAVRVLVNDSASEGDIELIRDGSTRGATFYNRASDGHPRINYYGYEWDEPRTIATLVYNPGRPEEWGGWFTSLAVEYRDEFGRWRSARLNGISPRLNFDNTQWLKGAFIDHSLSIETVTTRAVRIIGNAGGIEQDQRNGGERRFYTAISELAVYSD
jgi:ADP-ribosylglycohydrolase